MVYLDANGNRLLDAGKTSTITDAEGRFRRDFSALSGVLVAQGAPM